MAIEARKISSMPTANAVANSDLLVIVKAAGTAGANTYQITSVNYFANLGFNAKFSLVGSSLNTTPANSTATTISPGYFWTDGTYFYVSTATDVVKRVALSSF